MVDGFVLSVKHLWRIFIMLSAFKIMAHMEISFFVKSWGNCICTDEFI